MKKGPSLEKQATGDSVSNGKHTGVAEDSGDRRADADGPKASAVVASPSRDDAEPKQAQCVAPEMVEVTLNLSQRPFGMAPSKEPGTAGYVVSKVAESRPAHEAGVQVGWRVVSVAGTPCKESDLDAIQALLKSAQLPVSIVFEKVKEDLAGGDDSEEDSEMDILEARVEQRNAHASALANIDDLPVKREPDDLPPPIKSWQDACSRSLLNKSLMDTLTAAGLKRPTLIQRHALPIAGHQSGHYDMIALAQTGSGKTFAFVIPTVARLVMQGAMPRPFFPGKSPGSPLLLVLSPTRELAMQTCKEIEVLAKGSGLAPVCVYGGETLKFQQQRIEKSQIDICCATPGRLIDLIDSGALSLSFVQSVVLDEADQMLEQSLEVMCAEILTGRDMPEPSSGRQTLLFSATMPPKIRELCPKILRQQSIASITIGHYGDDKGGSCASIKQILRWLPDEHQRIYAMVEDLRTHWMGLGKKGRVVIFTNQRVQAAMLANALIQHGINCLHLHGKLDQHVREEVFTQFRRGQSDVLVATNVASRGLDFPDISFVVQFNLPNDINIYTHRIGRTGRVGQVGCALAYMGPKDRHLSGKLVEFLELNKQEVPDFLRPRSSPPRRRGRSYSRGRRR